MKSEAQSVTQYLKELPDSRQRPIGAIRALIKQRVPKVKEFMKYGHPHYDLDGPLFSLGSQMHYMAFYVAEAAVVSDFLKRTDRKNTGKTCIRFTELNPIPEEEIKKVIDDAVALRIKNSPTKRCNHHLPASRFLLLLAP